MEYQRETVIQAPAERIWALLEDVENWPSWTDSMDEITRLEAGPLAVGSTARVRQPRGRPMVWRVTALDPGRNFTWTASLPGMTLTAGHLMSGSESGPLTTLTFSMTGPLAPLGSLLAGKRIRSYTDLELAGLRRAAERSG